MMRTRTSSGRRWAIACGLGLLLAACGGDGSAPTPPPFDEALLAHFSEGLGDASLAAALIDRLGPVTIDAFDAATGGNVDHLLLALSLPGVDADEIDSVVVFAFGNRIAADGTTTPGPMNEAIADATAAFIAEHPVPVYAQWEVAGLLVDRGFDDVVSIGTTVDESGNVVYLSTAGVARQAVDLAARDGVELGHVGVIAFADHAVRSVLTARAAGMSADTPRQVVFPSVYDPASGQPWTRDRLTYLSIDLPARLALADRPDARP